MTEDKQQQEVIVLPNYVIEVKQDRWKNWICSKMRVQGDTIKIINIKLKAAIKAVNTSLKELNSDE